MPVRLNLLSWLFGNAEVARMQITLTTDERPLSARHDGLLKRPRRGQAPPSSMSTHLLRDIGLDRSRS